ncbi:MAG: hypothetical protein ACYTXC_00205, partial [Nostoc sp.]
MDTGNETTPHVLLKLVTGRHQPQDMREQDDSKSKCLNQPEPNPLCRRFCGSPQRQSRCPKMPRNYLG